MLKVVRSRLAKQVFVAVLAIIVEHVASDE
jgi:hypothetical protein